MRSPSPTQSYIELSPMPANTESEYDGTLPASSPMSQDTQSSRPARVRRTSSQCSSSVESSSVPSDSSGLLEVEALISEADLNNSGESEVEDEEETENIVQCRTRASTAFMSMLQAKGHLQPGDNEVPFLWPSPHQAPPVVRKGLNSAANFVTKMQSRGTVSILSDNPVPYHLQNTRVRSSRPVGRSAKPKTSKSAGSRGISRTTSTSQASSTVTSGKQKASKHDPGSTFLQDLNRHGDTAVAVIADWVSLSVQAVRPALTSLPSRRTRSPTALIWMC